MTKQEALEFHLVLVKSRAHAQAMQGRTAVAIVKRDGVIDCVQFDPDDPSEVASVFRTPFGQAPREEPEDRRPSYALGQTIIWGSTPVRES
jgi:hypothetical protein